MIARSKGVIHGTGHCEVLIEQTPGSMSLGCCLTGRSDSACYASGMSTHNMQPQLGISDGACVSRSGRWATQRIWTFTALLAMTYELCQLGRGSYLRLTGCTRTEGQQLPHRQRQQMLLCTTVLCEAGRRPQPPLPWHSCRCANPCSLVSPSANPCTLPSWLPPVINLFALEACHCMLDVSMSAGSTIVC